MSKHNQLYLSFFCLIFFAACQPKNELFTLLPAAKTGIDFQNNLADVDAVDIYERYFFYNGAGVVSADFNQDGLEDLLFCGNEVPTQFYKNLGNLKFENITEIAGLQTDRWHTGATFADVNADGLTDIFICTADAGKTSQLFINQGIDEQGNPFFKEEAAAYGLAINNTATHSAFLDYDVDGDLDLFVGINSQIMNYRNLIKIPTKDKALLTSDLLFRNDGKGHFEEVSAIAGITEEGSTLGIAINDLNQDGYPDIYVANDFISSDILYLNNQDGTFTNKAKEYLRQTTFHGMGVDIADVNQDGNMDITVLDMLPVSNKRQKMMQTAVSYTVNEFREEEGFLPQVVRNTFQLNQGKTANGDLNFSEIACQLDIHATDWSWAPLWADFDLNGALDLYITNGYLRDITDLDIANGLDKRGNFGTQDSQDAARLALQRTASPIKEVNILYQNEGHLNLKNTTKTTGIRQASISHGGAFADLDNDGDLEIIVNNVEPQAFVYQNNSVEQGNDNANYLSIKLKGNQQNLDALGTTLKLFYDGKTQHYFHSYVRGYMSSMSHRIHFGLGAVSALDSLLIQWPDGSQQVLKNVATNQFLNIGYQPTRKVPSEKTIIKPIFQEIEKEGLVFQHKENKYIDFDNDPLFQRMYSREGPGIAVADVDGNGLEDVFIGSAAGQVSGLFFQMKDQIFQQKSTFETDKAYEDGGALFFDIDRDGDQDLYVVSGGGTKINPQLHQDRLYINDGTGNFSKQILPPNQSSGSAVKGADYDRDGDIDLFVGGRIAPGKYPTAPNSFLWQNENGQLVNKTPKELRNIGMVTDAIWTDFNNDNWIDLIIVGEWMNITFVENQQGSLKIENSILMLSGENSSGWWNSITGSDIDADGDIDYILGNFGNNTPIKASQEHPIRLYAADFDNNNKVDPILSCYLLDDNGESMEVPLPTRDILASQLVGTKRRFPNYLAYAQAPFEHVLLEQEQKKAKIFKATTFNSILLRKMNDGQFKIEILPQAAQAAPVFGVLPIDTNQDGVSEILLSGNLRAIHPIIGRHNASNGVLLKSGTNDLLQDLPNTESGLQLNGAQRSLAQLWIGDHPHILATANDGRLKILTSNRSNQTKPPTNFYHPKPTDAYALLFLKNGQTIKQEFYLGNGYMAQSSSRLSISNSVEKVLIYDINGTATALKK